MPVVGRRSPCSALQGERRSWSAWPLGPRLWDELLRDAKQRRAPQCLEDKVLMEPLEGHYFVQGDIEDVATVRPEDWEGQRRRVR